MEAMDLVRARRVLVRGGFAYIPRDELMSLVVGVFRSKLSHNLGQFDSTFKLDLKGGTES